MKTKHNLVLVHSFPTNSILLSGLEEFLADYFNVFFIDLPGFVKNVEALDNISLDNYSDFVETSIEKLKLTSYVLGGISFGFSVVNNIKDTEGCKAIIAMEPYINSDYLHIGFLKRFLFSHLLDELAENSTLREKLWNNNYADEVLAFLSGQTVDRTQTILQEFDSRTFLLTARQIIENVNDIAFKNSLPYILIINNEDETVDTDKIEQLFKENIAEDRLLTVYTDIEHYPGDVSKEYFKSKIPHTEMTRLIDWFEEKINNR